MEKYRLDCCPCGQGRFKLTICTDDDRPITILKVKKQNHIKKTGFSPFILVDCIESCRIYKSENLLTLDTYHPWTRDWIDDAPFVRQHWQQVAVGNSIDRLLVVLLLHGCQR